MDPNEFLMGGGGRSAKYQPPAQQVTVPDDTPAPSAAAEDFSPF